MSGNVVVGKGEAAKGGSLVFSPVGPPDRKAATATIKPDGTYSLGTNGEDDGAAPGKYRVSFTPPPQELTDEQRTNPKYKAPPPLYYGMGVKPEEVEVKPGTNTIDLELVPKGK